MTTKIETISVDGDATSLERRRFLIAGLSAAATIATGTNEAFAQGGSKVLRYGLSAYPPNVQPFQYTGQPAATVKLQIYRGLLSYSDEGKIVPEIAESYTLQGDRTYVFKLRPGIRFANGSPLTSADVKFSLEQIAAPDSTAYLLNEMRAIESIDASDPSVVKITLKSPTPAFPDHLARPDAPIVSPKFKDPVTGQPLGAGPFVLEAMDRGISVTFKKNPYFYRAGLPKVDSMRFVVYADENLRVAAVQSGDVDIIEYVPWQNLQQLKSDSRVRVEASEGAFMYLCFNTQAAPFNDPRVRLAVAHAIKREDIVTGAFYGQGSPFDGLPIQKTSSFYNPALQHLWPYDPDKAAKLIQEAGVAGQKINLLASSTYAMHRDIAQIVQQYLTAVGLQVQLQLPDWGTRVSLGNQGRYQLAVNGGALDGLDPDGLTTLIGSGPPSYRRSFGFQSATLDQLLAQGRQEVEPAKRKQIYDSVSRQAAKDTPITTLAYRVEAYAVNPKVAGFKTLPGNLDVYTAVTLQNTTV
ncbi:ABC transporter substrate-binding protein [Paraburkholderia sp. J8-2]|uniref:ABC transporter substrate-binding protein n=1 Tax=Paraburkholderia sp. J8-2 TaxID=2805440 RepID=UPI002AB70A3D|nr:ABC transporter substrate-binding protein [Paraburkholderia sp. J8-2]